MSKSKNEEFREKYCNWWNCIDLVDIISDMISDIIGIVCYHSYSQKKHNSLLVGTISLNKNTTRQNSISPSRSILY